jgi:anti-sigma B factor antagonist
MSTAMHTSLTRTGEQTVLRVGGEIDLGNAALLDGAIREALEDGTSSLVVDLSELAYIDSAGLAALHRAARRIEALDGSFVVVVPDDSPCARTFAVAALDWLVATSAPPLEPGPDGSPGAEA